MLAIGKDLRLQGQERSAGVDQVEAGQVVLERDLLRAEVLLYGERVVGPALDGGVVGHDDALDAPDAADSGDDPGRGGLAGVHLPGREGTDLQER